MGKTLSHYRILEPLGAGGMGEVYLAEDTRLGRQVAIKVLPEEYASDPERLARFEQEARAAAALNHPHIAVVHDVGSEGDRHFIVQEYLQGQSLRERLEKGALPLETTLDLANEVGEALVAAHKAGIIHRDLKPDNLFITEEGHAKVLDFGLAKLIEEAPPSDSNLSGSPTLLGSVAGQVMGTAGYMAPEQVNGQEVDARVDLFAFGCVLYEMVTGRRAFAGESVVQTLSKIVHEEPAPISQIATASPMELERIVRKCLAKDANRRYQHADEVVIDFRRLQDDIASGSARPAPRVEDEVTPFVGDTRSSLWKLLPLATLLAGFLVGVLGTGLVTRPEAPLPRMPVAFDFELPEELAFGNMGRRVIDISPDGSRIVFVANGQLWMRTIADGGPPVPIPGTEGGAQPFFSPEGQEIGFTARESGNGYIKRVGVTGGAPTTIGRYTGNSQGASWAADDTIYFGQSYFGQRDAGIWKVPGRGGTPEPVIEVEQSEEAYAPSLLPGGEWVLFSLRGNPTDAWSDASVVAQSLVTGDRVVLVEGGTDARWVPSGHLVYVRNGTLFAVPFDPAAIEPPSGPASVVEGIQMAPGGAFGTAHYSVSDDGTLVYVPGHTASAAYQLVWLQRNGDIEPLPFEPRPAANPRLSSNGRLIAVNILGDDRRPDIWVYEVDRPGSEVRLTTEGNNAVPVWSPDSEWIFFVSDRGGNGDIWKRRIDRSLEAELVLDAESPLFPRAISHDGTMLLLDITEPRFGDGLKDGYEFAPGAPSDVGILRLDAGQEPEWILATDAREYGGDFSPDGRFFTYHSNESGLWQVYAREIEGGRTFPVSTRPIPGIWPRWPHAGEIFYIRSGAAPGVVMVEVATDTLFASDPVQFSDADTRDFSTIDVTDDGERVLMITPSDEGTANPEQRVEVFVNWFQRLEELVPVRQ